MTRFLVLFPVVDSSKNWDRDWSLVKTHVLNANPRTIAFFTYYKLSKCFHAYTYYLVIYSIPSFVGKINLHLFCGNRIKIWLIFKRHPGYIPGWHTSKIQPKGLAMSPNKWTPSAFPLASESVWSNPKHPFWADFHHLLHLSETAEIAILAYALPDCWDGIYGHNMDIVNSRYDVFKMGWWFTKLHFNRE